MLIREVDTVPDLARRFYDAQLSRLRHSLEDIYREHLGTVPAAFDVRAFHTLATYGVRYLVSATDLDPKMIEVQSGLVSRIMHPAPGS